MADRAAVSIGAEETFEHDLVDGPQLRRHITAQAERVAERLRRTRQLAGCVVLKLKDPEFHITTRRRTLPAPTSDGRVIARGGARAARRGQGARAGRAPLGRGGDVDGARRCAAPADARRARARARRAARRDARSHPRSLRHGRRRARRADCPTTTESDMADDEEGREEPPSKAATPRRRPPSAEEEDARPRPRSRRHVEARPLHHEVPHVPVELRHRRGGAHRHVDLAVPAVGDRARIRPSRSRRWPRRRPTTSGASSAPRSWPRTCQVLASPGPGTVEQRYGVLLSLARGNILDPELAVSYALELGKDNPDYMESVLANTAGKDYLRLSRAFVLPCEEKYGIARNVPACAADKLAPRSAAIAQLISDETQAAADAGAAGAAGDAQGRARGAAERGALRGPLRGHAQRLLRAAAVERDRQVRGLLDGRARRRGAGAGGGAHRRVRHRRRGQEARRVPRRADAVDVEVSDGLDAATPSARARSSR